MFDNKIFDQWLDKKTDEILSKIDKEQITTEEMIVLSLKAQSNHFFHMDIEFRSEFKRIDNQFAQVYKQFEEVDKRFVEVYKRFEQVDKRFEQVDKRFEQIDKRFDRLTTIMMWGFGTMITCFMGVFFQLLKH